MTDHQQDAGPVDAPAVEASTSDRLRAVFADDIAPANEDEEQVSKDTQAVDPETDELSEVDFDEEGEQADEGESPIDVPVSLNAEEKAAFGQLPPEAQSFVTALEARRNADVTKVTTKAAEAQRAAEAQAAQREIEAKRVYATQLMQVASAFMPQEPQRHNYANDVEYLVATRQHDQMLAQHREFVQQVQSIGGEAEEEAQTAFVQARDKALMQIPEIANEETRQAYLDRVFDTELVNALGYERSELAQIADADDVKRLNTIADWREKAAKYDKAMSRKMEHVRKGKNRSTRPGTDQQQSTRVRTIEQAKAQQRKTGGKQGTKEALRALLVPEQG